MSALLRAIRGNRLLWLLVFVPLVLLCAGLEPSAHTAIFALSVPAIIPLAGLLSLATESVAARTGDAVGGLLNATLAATLVTSSGRSAWFVGVLLFMVYLVFGLPPRSGLGVRRAHFRGALRPHHGARVHRFVERGRRRS